MRRPRRLALAALAVPLAALAPGTPPSEDPARPVEARVRDLLARMTLEEKVAQTKGLWKQEDRITDEKGQFVPDLAASVFSSTCRTGYPRWRGPGSWGGSRRVTLAPGERHSLTFLPGPAALRSPASG